jgi:NAD(P)H-flavin reductase
VPHTEIEKDAERGREGGRQTDFVDMLVHAVVANIYNCDGSGSLRTTVQSKSSYLKILKV